MATWRPPPFTTASRAPGSTGADHQRSFYRAAAPEPSTGEFSSSRFRDADGASAATALVIQAAVPGIGILIAPFDLGAILCIGEHSVSSRGICFIGVLARFDWCSIWTSSVDVSICVHELYATTTALRKGKYFRPEEIVSIKAFAQLLQQTATPIYSDCAFSYGISRMDRTSSVLNRAVIQAAYNDAVSFVQQRLLLMDAPARLPREHQPRRGAAIEEVQ